jgi:hypothetical protein
MRPRTRAQAYSLILQIQGISEQVERYGTRETFDAMARIAQLVGVNPALCASTEDYHAQIRKRVQSIIIQWLTVPYEARHQSDVCGEN